MTWRSISSWGGDGPYEARRFRPDIAPGDPDSCALRVCRTCTRGTRPWTGARRVVTRTLGTPCLRPGENKR